MAIVKVDKTKKILTDWMYIVFFGHFVSICSPFLNCMWKNVLYISTIAFSTRSAARYSMESIRERKGNTGIWVGTKESNLLNEYAWEWWFLRKKLKQLSFYSWVELRDAATWNDALLACGFVWTRNAVIIIMKALELFVSFHISYINIFQSTYLYACMY